MFTSAVGSARVRPGCNQSRREEANFSSGRPTRAATVASDRSDHLRRVARRDESRQHLDDFDRAMIEFILLWVPYGGPPVDEILPRFGILSYELPGRIDEIASRCLGGNVSVEDRSRIIEALDAVARSSADGHFEFTGLERTW